MSHEAVVIQSPSEEGILSKRGYHLLHLLGEGSYAKVYLGEYANPETPERVTTLACKVIDSSRAPRDFVRKFLPRELDILVRLNHPNIVHVHSIFQRRNKHYIFMRYAENGDLLDFIVKNGAVAEDQAQVWFKQLALALQYLHNMDIAHRDLKCENVLITANFNVKLADFGFARYCSEGKRRVLSDTYCGSLSYAAPEIIRGCPYNPKYADIWSLGVVLFIMLNKAMPFDDTNVKRLYDQQLSRQWKFRSKVSGSLSEEVRLVVVNLLEPDITRRWRVEHILTSEWLNPHQVPHWDLSRRRQHGEVGTSGARTTFAPIEHRRTQMEMETVDDLQQDTEGAGPSTAQSEAKGGPSVLSRDSKSPSLPPRDSRTESSRATTASVHSQEFVSKDPKSRSLPPVDTNGEPNAPKTSTVASQEVRLVDANGDPVAPSSFPPKDSDILVLATPNEPSVSSKEVLPKMPKIQTSSNPEGDDEMILLKRTDETRKELEKISSPIDAK